MPLVENSRPMPSPLHAPAYPDAAPASCNVAQPPVRYSASIPGKSAGRPIEVHARRASDEQFPALSPAPCRYGFITRVPGVNVTCDKAEALRQLDARHREIRRAIGLAGWPLVTAEQIHSDKIAVVDAPVKADRTICRLRRNRDEPTRQCSWASMLPIAALFTLSIPKHRSSAWSILGRKERDSAIAAQAIELMKEKFGSNPVG